MFRHRDDDDVKIYLILRLIQIFAAINLTASVSHPRVHTTMMTMQNENDFGLLNANRKNDIYLVSFLMM